MNISRKQLLATGTCVALTPAFVRAAPVSAELPAFHFDDARFASILARPARHRQCCASTKIAGGAVLHAMLASLYAYQFDLGEGPGTMHTVAVLYHGSAIALGLDDRIWNELLIPALPHLGSDMRSDITHGEAPLAGHGNPFLHRNKADALEDDASIEALVSRGSHFFVCNNALEGVSWEIARALGQPGAVVYQRLVGGLVFGAMAVPAGVMAINACQEAHFTYLQTTL